jgi:Uri superfamily endonuclease
MKIECRISGIVGRYFEAVKGFGASDCRCVTHLYHSTLHPGVKLREILTESGFDFFRVKEEGLK